MAAIHQLATHTDSVSSRLGHSPVRCVAMVDISLRVLKLAQNAIAHCASKRCAEDERILLAANANIYAPWRTVLDEQLKLEIAASFISHPTNLASQRKTRVTANSVEEFVCSNEA